MRICPSISKSKSNVPGLGFLHRQSPSIRQCTLNQLKDLIPRLAFRHSTMRIHRAVIELCLASLVYARADSLVITQFTLHPTPNVSVAATNSSYYVLYRSELVTEVRTAVGIANGLNGVAQLKDPSPAVELGNRFYRVVQVPLIASLDSDNDGLSDVYELSQSSRLDPLNPADANLDPDADGVSTLEEVRRGSDPFSKGTSTNWQGRITAGEYYSAAIRPDGTLWAWGGNDQGQVGMGDSTNRLVPAAVQPNEKWLAYDLRRRERWFALDMGRQIPRSDRKWRFRVHSSAESNRHSSGSAMASSGCEWQYVLRDSHGRFALGLGGKHPRPAWRRHIRRSANSSSYFPWRSLATNRGRTYVLRRNPRGWIPVDLGATTPQACWESGRRSPKLSQHRFWRATSGHPSLRDTPLASRSIRVVHFGRGVRAIWAMALRVFALRPLPFKQAKPGIKSPARSTSWESSRMAASGTGEADKGVL